MLAQAVLQAEAADRAVTDGSAELEEQLLALLHARAGVLALERDGEERPCCNGKGASAMRDYAKQRVKELGLASEGKLRVNANFRDVLPYQIGN